MASRPQAKAAAPRSPRLQDGDPTQTRARILDAAFRRLVAEGYAALSVREIARDAGVNHALINYHFRSKEQLVIDVLDAVNQRLLARQSTMYQSGGGFAEKWAAARRFYADDLASGFVRLQAELMAASLSNPTLRENFLPRLLAWKQLVLGSVRDALDALAADGGKLPAPFTPEVVATLISEFWLGMEFADLLNAPGERKVHVAALDAIEQLLASLDTRLTKGSGRKRVNVIKGK
jgi:AcrR family transcriptional regulator